MNVHHYTISGIPEARSVSTATSPMCVIEEVPPDAANLPSTSTGYRGRFVSAPEVDAGVDGMQFESAVVAESVDPLLGGAARRGGDGSLADLYDDDYSQFLTFLGSDVSMPFYLDRDEEEWVVDELVSEEMGLGPEVFSTEGGAGSNDGVE